MWSACASPFAASVELLLFKENPGCTQLTAGRLDTASDYPAASPGSNYPKSALRPKSVTCTYLQVLSERRRNSIPPVFLAYAIEQIKMRLWSTETLDTHEFPAIIPEDIIYAVLSHTPDHGDTVEMDLGDAAMKSDKFQSFHRLASKLGCEYCWVDSFCINRKSPAGFSEKNDALASKYTMFRDAQAACVYLADVKGEDSLSTAGWLTQSTAMVELLAPQPDNMRFYDHDWRYLGSKRSLATSLANITGIPMDILFYKRNPVNATVAEKLSWVSEKRVKAGEDNIYDLISLLGVHMDMRHGEGAIMATARMKEQIMVKLEDYTLLIWQKPLGLAGRTQKTHYRRHDAEEDFESTLEDPDYHQLRLHSPTNLISSEELREHLPAFARPPESPQLTSRGLRVFLLAKPVASFLIAWTYCTQIKNERLYAVCIRVVAASKLKREQQYHFERATSGRVCYVSVDRLRGFEVKEIYFSLEIR